MLSKEQPFMRNMSPSSMVSESFSMRYLKKCSRNIYSEDEGYTDSDDSDPFNQLSGADLNSLPQKRGDKKDQFYGVYKHPQVQFLEDVLKDEFNNYEKLEFDNQNVANGESNAFDNANQFESF